MHQNKYRRGNKFAGIIAILLVLLGAMALFGFNFGYFGGVFWSFSPLMIIIVIIVIMVGVGSRNKRIRQQRQEERSRGAYSPYRPYEPPTVKSEENHSGPVETQKYRNSYEQQFCNYCGIKLDSEEQTFCVNCGQRLN